MGTLTISHVTPSYYPFIGGMEYVVKSVARETARLGHRVQIHTLDPTNALRKTEDLEGVTIKRYYGVCPHNAYFLPSPKLLKAVLKEEADVVHVHNIGALTSTTIWSQKTFRENQKIVLTPYYHGSGHNFIRNLLWRIYHAAAKDFIDKAEVVHTVSELEAELVARDFQRHAIVIENGVDDDLQEFSWNPIPGRILYAGRLEKYKGVDRLISIAKSLKDSFMPGVTLVIIGEGAYRNELMRQSQRLGLDCRFLPFLTREDYLTELSKAHALALLSSKESYPQSINEAQAMGVPVVIAGSWTRGFRDRPRTFVFDKIPSKEGPVKMLASFLADAYQQPRPKVPLWRTVVKNKYLRVYLSCIAS